MIIQNIEQLRALLPSINVRVDSHRLDDFIRYMDSTGNTYEWIKLY